MQIEKEFKKEPQSKITVQVKVDKNEIERIREKIIRNFEKNATLPGFRKGRVPRNIILSRFSDKIKSETITNILYESLDQIVKESEYNPISDPVVTDIGELTSDSNFTYSAEFDIMPELAVENYKGIDTTKYVYEVTDETVSRELDALRDRFATLVSVDEPAQIGHYLVIDYTEYDQEGKVKSKKADQTILLDDPENSFVKQLLGAKKGEARDLTLSYERTQDGKTAPQQVNLHVLISEVKNKELPPLDDDFAQDISDVLTLDELKERIRKDLKEEAGNRSEEKTKEEIMNVLINKTDIDLPESMINYEIDRLLADIASSYKIDLEKLKKDEKQWGEYRKSLRSRAIMNIKYELILSEIAKKEGIKVNDEEVNREIQEYATEHKRDFNELKKTMEQNKSIENLHYHLMLKKALTFLYEKAHYTKTQKMPFKSEEEQEGGTE